MTEARRNDIFNACIADAEKIIEEYTYFDETSE